MEKTYQHWQTRLDQTNILWLSLDRADSQVNSLNAEVVDEFEQILDSIASNALPKAVVIASSKPKGFIAGADIQSFQHFTDVNEVVSFVRNGQKVFAKLENLAVPTIAMIEGFCLGGGLELALACRYRVAEDSKPTRLGLPEVKLGIHPGWGGSVRLVQKIGPIGAMDLILSGRTVSAKAAQKMGFVDAAVPKRMLIRAVEYYAEKQPAASGPVWWQKLLNWAPLRPVLAWQLRKQVAAKARQAHYPAPYAVIDNWVNDGAKGEQAYENEAHSIGKLFLTETAKNLVQVFFMQEKLKQLGKQGDVTFKHVHVIGAGTMGGDIAAWCALRGMRVTLEDREAKYIAPAIGRAYTLYKKKCRKLALINEALDRLQPDPQGRGVKNADIIIEAIFENLEAKQALFKRLEEQAKPGAILATNTSSIPLDEINTVLQDPSRLVGVHFFNPVAKMPLVEVVQGEKTATSVVESATQFVHQIDRLPLPVKSSPGFLVNRVLMPYLVECMLLIEEGVPLPAIDKAALEFGMPMGPVELADTVGLDVCLSVAENLMSHFGGEVPGKLQQLVKQGNLGRKTGRGFYQYKNGKPVKAKLPKGYSMSKDVQLRLVYRMLNEAKACLREGVVASAELLDVGMIFGTGFAPFTAGPMHYVAAQGESEVVKTLERLVDQYGERFKPDQAWKPSIAVIDNLVVEES